MKVIEKPNLRMRFEDAVELAKMIYGPGISVSFDDKCIDKIVIDLTYGSVSEIFAECHKVKIVSEDGHEVYFPIQNRVQKYTYEEGSQIIKGKLT